MEPRATLLGFPLHRMLVVFPLGLLATSFFFDIAWLVTGRSELSIVAWWMIFAGVLGGIAAAIFGVIDWPALARGTRARRVGALHGVGSMVTAVLFAVSWLLRRDEPAHPQAIAIALSAAGVLLSVVTGFLGGRLMEE
jgi:uncharacterized membrane protein